MKEKQKTESQMFNLKLKYITIQRIQKTKLLGN